MNTIHAGRDARADAARRLGNLTIGTAVLGVVATGGLAAIAATTNDGTDKSASAVVTTAAQSTAAPTPGTTPATATTPSAPVVTTATGPGNASTGGS